MAGQIDPPGQFQEFLDILKRRRWQVILPALFVVSLGICIATIIPRKFRVGTEIELRALTLEEDGGKAARSRTMGVAEDAPQQIRSMKRIVEVLKDLEWPDYLSLDAKEQSRFRRAIQKDVFVTVPRPSKDAVTAFVTVEYLDVNPDRAQQFLKALVRAWTVQVVERDKMRIEGEFENLQGRKTDLEKLWNKLSNEQAQNRTNNGLSLTQPTPGRNQQRLEDPTSLRFNANETRLEKVRRDVSVARRTLTVKKRQLENTEPEVRKVSVTEGVSYGDQIEELEQQRVELDGKLVGIRPAHSRYKQTLIEISNLEEQIQELRSLQTKNQYSRDFVTNPRFAALQGDVNRLESSIAGYMAEMENLDKALTVDKDAILRKSDAMRVDSELAIRIDRVTRTLEDIEVLLQRKRLQRDIISGPVGNPFQIIRDVQAPASAAEPDPLLIVTFSVFLGAAIGLALSLAWEFSKNCFRNTSDISRVMVVPVLGVISPIITRVQRRRKGLRRLVVGSATMLIMASILFITWAWKFEPDMLGDRVLDSIEDFRSLLL